MSTLNNKLINKIYNHFQNSSDVIRELKTFEKEIILFANKISKTRNKNKVLVAGNGGSCADADHFTGELQCTFKDRDRKPISAISLNNSFPAITAWCNDFSFDTYVYWLALKNDYKIIRKNFDFPPRVYGNSKWNFGIKSRLIFALNLCYYKKHLLESCLLQLV